jgi:glycosyltransferase involved in cell wall biosynthesis
LRIAVPSLVTSWSRLRTIKPDVVHVNTEWGCGWEGLLAAKALNVPVIGTFHTFFAEPGYLKCLGLPNWRWIRALMWKYSISFFNCCHTVTSPSAAVRRALLDHGLKREPVVISNGIAQPRLLHASSIADLRAEHGVSGPSFVYVGRISPEKSTDVLLKAFQRVALEYPAARLVFVGDGPHRARLTQLSQELRIAAQVIQLGFVPHEQLMARNLPLLGDVFVTASKTENQPLSVLEAMAFGLPVIGPRAHGLCELIVHGHNGLAFPPDDVRALAGCMTGLIEDEALRRAMGANSRQFAAAHGLVRVLDQWEEVYRRLLGQSPLTTKPTVLDSSAAA